MEIDNNARSTKFPLDQTFSLEGLIVLDAEGYFKSLNEQAKLLLAIDHVENRKIQECICFYDMENLHPLSFDELSFHQTLATDTDHFDMTYGIKLEDNTFRWLSFSSRVQKDKSKTYVLLAFHDVSKLVNQNKELFEKKEQLQLLIASLDDLVFEVTHEGIFTNYWTNTPDLLFYKPEYFLGKNLGDLFSGPLVATTLALIRKAIDRDKVYKLQFPSPFESHKGKWYRLKVKPIHLTTDRVILVISDISKHVASLEKIRFNVHKFDQAFQFSGLGMSLTSLQGYCIESNKNLSKILGYSQEELSELNFLDLTHPDDLENDYHQRQRLVTGEMDSFTLEKRYRHKLGHYFWCSVTISAVQNQDNEVSFFIVQLQDISVAKKNMDILESQKQELEFVKVNLETKVRQLEEFNQIVAHHLRGPVSNIHMLIEELKKESSTEVKHEYLTLIESSNNNLTDTLQELSDILELRIDNQTIAHDNCHFQTIFETVSHQFSEDIQQKKSIITTDFQVENIIYPKIYLENIFNNLLSNALNYTDPEVSPVIHLKTYMEDNSTILSIQDNGIGIDLPKFKSQIFMFRKVFHRGFDSKGIGLFMTRYQVEALGGKIDIESALHKGSTFLVKFLENK
ncbi:PAS domain S-box protein [Sphingobacterium faecium]|uniref:PAS domain S-box protein n=1 Tax=Sphingobacterium faecium TaxID=34087 RepID=UPI00246954DE|nr:PAS domain S-box protein [Sphingobacterium faecium]MDH5828067.1 PAS domain S-box protein [Sphingobacterium faecium]